MAEENLTGSFKITTTKPVPRFERRMGDWSQEGANNTLIFLGTDRAKEGGGPATIFDGMGTFRKEYRSGDKRLGAIHLVAGRVDGKGNTDIVGDDATLYLSSYTKPESNLALTNVQGNRENGWPDAEKSSPVPAAVLKSNHIRLVYRNSGDIRIASDGANSFLMMNDDFIDGYVAKNIWLNAGETKVEIRNQDNDGVIRLGPLAKALADLVQRIMEEVTRPGNTISSTGNLMAPVPGNGTFQIALQQSLQEWMLKWINDGGEGDYFKKP